MRVDINLASQPYEDARLFWLRWGGGLVALGVLTLLLLIITVNGWIGARKDRQLIRQYEAQSAARDKEQADAVALLNLPQNSQHAGSLPVPQRPLPAKILFLDQGL